MTKISNFLSDAIGSCCSAVFSLFVLCPFNSNDTKSGIKEIADVNPDDRREMIEFIYTGSSSLLAQSSYATEMKAGTNLAIGSLQVADKYSLDNFVKGKIT